MQIVCLSNKIVRHVYYIIKSYVIWLYDNNNNIEDYKYMKIPPDLFKPKIQTKYNLRSSTKAPSNKKQKLNNNSSTTSNNNNNNIFTPKLDKEFIMKVIHLVGEYEAKNENDHPQPRDIINFPIQQQNRQRSKDETDKL